MLIGRLVASEVLTDHWPTTNTKSMSAMRRIRSSHCVNPLKAFDIEGHVIHPQYYRSRLQGALVAITFTLTLTVTPQTRHSKPIDVYVADIQGIQILKDPMPIVDMYPPLPRHDQYTLYCPPAASDSTTSDRSAQE